MVISSVSCRFSRLNLNCDQGYSTCNTQWHGHGTGIRASRRQLFRVKCLRRAEKLSLSVSSLILVFSTLMLLTPLPNKYLNGFGQIPRPVPTRTGSDSPYSTVDTPMATCNMNTDLINGLVQWFSAFYFKCNPIKQANIARTPRHVTVCLFYIGIQIHFPDHFTFSLKKRSTTLLLLSNFKLFHILFSYNCTMSAPCIILFSLKFPLNTWDHHNLFYF